MEINEQITVVEYDPKWPSFFSREREAILGLGPFEHSSVEHFGSTAVPGLHSKPIIDILIGVDILPPSMEQILGLRSIFYESMGEGGVSGRYYFRKRQALAFNVAIVHLNGALWNNNLLIRDYLRAHFDAALRYTKFKSSLISAGHRDLLTYSSGKKAFMDELLNAAKAWALPQ